MTNSRLLKTLFLSTTLLGACMADADSTDTQEQSDPTTIVKMMPLQGQGAKVSDAITPAIAGLTYFGGPVLTHIDVHPVFWNSATKLQSNINAFYPAVVGAGSTIYTSLLPQYKDAAD